MLFLGKVFQCVLTTQLQQNFLDATDYLGLFQSAFRPLFRTEITLVNDFRREVNRASASLRVYSQLLLTASATVSFGCSSPPVGWAGTILH